MQLFIFYTVLYFCAFSISIHEACFFAEKRYTELVEEKNK